MMSGTVIFANRNLEVSHDIERMLCFMCPQIHVEKTTSGNELLMMQSFMRADVILMDMNLRDVSTEHVIRTLERDIVRPYVIATQTANRPLIHQRAINAGADYTAVIPDDIGNVCETIATQMRRRCNMNYDSVLAEKKLQRIFMEYGIPCSMKGYGYLKIALGMLAGNREQIIGSMSRIYERIGAQQGCSAGCVERNIRYVIDKCWSRSRFSDLPRPGNGEFLAQLLEDCRAEKNNSLLKPRISVHCEQRRVFR